MTVSVFLMLAALSLVAVGAVLGIKDSQLIQTVALPNGAASTVITGFWLQSLKGDFAAGLELEVAAPALTVTQLADTQTIAYSVEMADDSAFSTNLTVVNANLFTQTGAGGVGAAAVTKRWRPPTDVKPYVRIKATKTGASNASTATLTVNCLIF